MRRIGDTVPNSRAIDMFGRFRSYVAVDDDVCAFFRRDFLTERAWRAAIVSEGLSAAEAVQLGSTCRQAGYERAWALDINQFDAGFL